MMMMSRAARIMLLLLLTALSGCTGLANLSGVTTPTDLYVLSPKSTFSASLPQLRDQIVVQQPTATAAVDTDQIAVQPTPLQVQYLPGVRWVDRAPLIVQALMIESFENTGKVPAVGSSTIGLRADYLIVTDIREFQAIVPPGPDASALQIDVRLNIKLIDSLSDRIIGSRSFEEIVPSASDAPDDVTQAFDEALGDTMRDAIEWSIRTIAQHAATGEG
ncbi:ABC-type transport auxiliary lipoprotein family protein [Roseobacter sinensis]|uniref:ABC-type transport auxiliary lipoprotein family protein n=1 Tax=Roseobacter sinensis TaxID=2931391 RepID=A0ABT3BAW8_9RHOB|nr:ABC-type transport auxiliary lipoprotein family protein [Roseobacter sp. WL0113]MCV3270692.1 ABC-type transport auxiliary lipoprotein family protein [Roseobacter sp. WL0113]